MTRGYGVITSQKMPWLDKTKKNKHQISYPIFQQLSDLTDDPFWKSILDKAAAGKLPTGFSFRDGVLTHKKGNKPAKVILGSNPVEALQAAITMFREHGGIMSDLDRQRDLANQPEVPRFSDLTWADLSKMKEVKALLIAEYIRRLGLSPDQQQHLQTIINIGFTLGSLTDQNIVYNRGRIQDITGIGRDGSGRFYLMSSGKARRSTTTKAKVTEDKGMFLVRWQKYLHKLRHDVSQSMSITAPEESEE